MAAPLKAAFTSACLCLPGQIPSRPIAGSQSLLSSTHPPSCTTLSYNPRTLKHPPARCSRPARPPGSPAALPVPPPPRRPAASSPRRAACEAASRREQPRHLSGLLLLPSLLSPPPLGRCRQYVHGHARAQTRGAPLSDPAARPACAPAAGQRGRAAAAATAAVAVAAPADILAAAAAAAVAVAAAAAAVTAVPRVATAAAAVGRLVRTLRSVCSRGRHTRATFANATAPALVRKTCWAGRTARGGRPRVFASSTRRIELGAGQLAGKSKWRGVEVWERAHTRMLVTHPRQGGREPYSDTAPSPPLCTYTGMQRVHKALPLASRLSPYTNCPPPRIFPTWKDTTESFHKCSWAIPAPCSICAYAHSSNQIESGST
eukprot:352175-Chlamydomonas_euryale.AAC.4